MTTQLNIDAEWIFVAPGREPPLSRASFEVKGGTVAAVGAGSASAGKGRAVLPSLVDSHDHGRAFHPIAFGIDDQPLEGWIAMVSHVPGIDL
jgi:cytosine/adenosine deaminase-related metal-dependent hydrolase